MASICFDKISHADNSYRYYGPLILYVYGMCLVTSPRAYAIPNQKVNTVAIKLIDSMFCQYSMTKQLHFDMGAQVDFSAVPKTL